MFERSKNPQDGEQRITHEPVIRISGGTCRWILPHDSPPQRMCDVTEVEHRGRISLLGTCGAWDVMNLPSGVIKSQCCCRIIHVAEVWKKFLQFGQVGQGLPRENTSSNIVFGGLPSKSVESGLPAVRIECILKINLNEGRSSFCLFQRPRSIPREISRHGFIIPRTHQICQVYRAIWSPTGKLYEIWVQLSEVFFCGSRQRLDRTSSSSAPPCAPFSQRAHINTIGLEIGERLSSGKFTFVFWDEISHDVW